MKHAEGARMVIVEMKSCVKHEKGSVVCAGSALIAGAADEVAAAEITTEAAEILIEEAEILIGGAEISVVAIEGRTDVDPELLARQVQDAGQGTVTLVLRTALTATSRITEVEVSERDVAAGVLPTHLHLPDLFHDQYPVHLRQEAEHVAGLVVFFENAVLEAGAGHFHQDEATEEEVTEDKAHGIAPVDARTHQRQPLAHPVLGPENLGE